MNEKKRKFKNYIRQWREFRGFASQGDLSTASGITRATVSRLESGALPYRQWHLEQLSKALECSESDLIGVNPYDNANIIQIYSKLTAVKKRQALRQLRDLAEDC